MNKIYLLLVLIFFVSCHPLRKAIRTFNENKQAAAEYCATEFPVKDSLIKGDTIFHSDTLIGTEFVHDTLLHNRIDTLIRTITKPVTITKTIAIHDTIVRENTARVEALMGQNNKQATQISKQQAQIEELTAFKKSMRGKIHIPWWWLVVAAGIGYTLFRFKILQAFNIFK